MNKTVWYHSDETGAPTLNNAAGSMIALLDACLLNGFNAKSVTSLVVASGVATATISAHGYETGKLVEFSGATSSATAINARQKVTVTNSNTVTFPVTGVPDGTITGTITAKRPALGWTKEFSGTNKAMYARTALGATAMKLRIDDTGSGVAGATYARALMVEAASGIDSYTDPSPTTSQLSGGVYWSKGFNSSSANRWVLVGDDRTFYLFTDHEIYTFTGYGQTLHPRGFGDIESYRAGDAYACMLMGDIDTSASMSGFYSIPLSTQPTAYGCMIARMSNQIDKSIQIQPSFRFTGIIGATGPSYPSPVDNGMVIETRGLVAENNVGFNNPIRGAYRGAMYPLAALGGRLHRRVISDIDGFTGEALVVGVQGQGTPGAVLLSLEDWA